jgi:hypothetical protein
MPVHDQPIFNMDLKKRKDVFVCSCFSSRCSSDLWEPLRCLKFEPAVRDRARQRAPPSPRPVLSTRRHSSASFLAVSRRSCSRSRLTWYRFSFSRIGAVVAACARGCAVGMLDQRSSNSSQGNKDAGGESASAFQAMRNRRICHQSSTYPDILLSHTPLRIPLTVSFYSTQRTTKSWGTLLRVRCEKRTRRTISRA